MSSASAVERAEMGITHSDFRRIFPRLVTDATRAHIDLVSEVEWPGAQSLTVNVSREFTRKIALLRIPYVNILLEFRGFDELQRDDFMRRFDRAFHKGGG
jgi:hypothetical protein